MNSVGYTLPLLAMKMADSTNPYWYDIYNTYTTFSPSYTPLIDEILIKYSNFLSPNLGDIYNYGFVSGYILAFPSIYSKLGVEEYTETGTKIPSTGFHYLYGRGLLNYITFEKKEEKSNGQNKIYYNCYVSPLQKEIYNKFIEDLKHVDNNTVEAMTVDSSDIRPSIKFTKKICGKPYPRQDKVIDEIMKRYTEENNFNVKVLIHGLTGTGKTYTARLLKKKMEERMKNISIKLYDDVKPTTVGLNIQTAILNSAQSITPVIILMNEIDRSYKFALQNHPIYDSRLMHARDKESLNDMLDAIKDVKYTICIFTTNLSKEELLKENVNYEPFMRKGRIDILVEMTHDDSIIMENN
jgi:hypothetical protein